MNWPMNVLVAIDQLGNAVAGGNPDATISARVGYFSKNAPASIKWYWQCLKAVIDFTFYPIDGPSHSLNALEKDKDERFIQGNDITRAILGLLVIVNSIHLALILRIAVLVWPPWNWKNNGSLSSGQ